jgi:hypothetical protein
MKYLGVIRGTGDLKCKAEILSRAEYDFEGFLTRPGRVTGGGEIRMPPDALRKVFGRTDLQILTDDGRLLGLRFSEKRLPAASNSAHVDITGDLPRQSGWRH